MSHKYVGNREETKFKIKGRKSQFFGNSLNDQIRKTAKEGGVYFHSPSQNGNSVLSAIYSIIQCI